MAFSSSKFNLNSNNALSKWLVVIVQKSSTGDTPSYFLFLILSADASALSFSSSSLAHWLIPSKSPYREKLTVNPKDSMYQSVAVNFYSIETSSVSPLLKLVPSAIL